MASRHLSRMTALQALFTADVLGDMSSRGVLNALAHNNASLTRGDEDHAFTEKVLKGVIAKHDEIDAVIQKSAPQWPIAKIAIVDRNILRIGLYELLFGESIAVPPKVALNEAIELAKTFGSESSGRFVNGVLGGVYRDLGSPRKAEAPKNKEKEYLAGIVVCSVFDGVMYVALVKDPFKKWTLPKTKYEKGELSDVAALRAAKEELGLTELKLKAPLSEHEYVAHDPEHGVVTRRVGYFLACSKKEPLRISKGEKVLEAVWFSEEEIVGLDVYEDLQSIIKSGMVTAQSSCI